MDRARTGDQGLGRHAADVDAGAAEGAALDDGGAQAFLGAARRQCRAGLAGTDDDGIEVFCTHDRVSVAQQRALSRLYGRTDALPLTSAAAIGEIGRAHV